MATRDVAADSWANVENTLKLATLSIAAIATCTQPFAPGMRRLRRLTAQIANSITPPTNTLMVRMVNGGTSLSAIRMIGQVAPQTTHKAASISRAPASPAAASAEGAGVGLLMDFPSANWSWRFRPRAQIPVDDLAA